MGKSSKPEQSKSFTPTAAGSVITPDTGYTLSQVTVNGDADLVSANIKSGANIFGVAGKASVVDTSAGDATAAQILSGKKAYVNGALVTGNLPVATAVASGTNTIVSGTRISRCQTTNAWVRLKEFTINYSGTYNIYVVWGAYSNSGIRVYKNGSALSSAYYDSSGTMQYTSLDYTLVAGDKIQVYGYKTTDGMVNLQAATCLRCLTLALATLSFEEAG